MTPSYSNINGDMLLEIPFCGFPSFSPSALMLCFDEEKTTEISWEKTSTEMIMAVTCNHRHLFARLGATIHAWDATTGRELWRWKELLEIK